MGRIAKAWRYPYINPGPFSATNSDRSEARGPKPQDMSRPQTSPSSSVYTHTLFSRLPLFVRAWATAEHVGMPVYDLLVLNRLQASTGL
jgi:hypothetical protein